MNVFAQDPLYANNMCAKFEGQKIYTKKDVLRRLLKLAIVKKKFTATHVGRFLMFLFGESFGLQVWYTCYYLRDNLVKQIHGKLPSFSPRGSIKVGMCDFFHCELKNAILIVTPLYNMDL